MRPSQTTTPRTTCPTLCDKCTGSLTSPASNVTLRTLSVGPVCGRNHDTIQFFLILIWIEFWPNEVSLSTNYFLVMSTFFPVFSRLFIVNKFSSGTKNLRLCTGARKGALEAGRTSTRYSGQPNSYGQVRKHYLHLKIGIINFPFVFLLFSFSRARFGVTNVKQGHSEKV